MQTESTPDLHIHVGTFWYVIQCRPRRETEAVVALRGHLDLEVYLPEVRRVTSGETQLTPFFPGYFFVRADLSEVRLSSINAVPGVVRLLQFGGGPQALPDRTIEAMQARLGALNEAGGLLPHSFKPGDSVRITQGPLRGLEAVFQGPMTPSQRVQVLLQFLGRPHEMKVDVEALEATSAPVLHRERRTRGKGRLVRGAVRE